MNWTKCPFISSRTIAGKTQLFFFPSRVQQLNVKFSELEDVVSVCDPQTTLGEALVIRGALADPPVVQDNLRGTRCLGHSQFNPVPKVM